MFDRERMQGMWHAEGTCWAQMSTVAGSACWSVGGQLLAAQGQTFWQRLGEQMFYLKCKCFANRGDTVISKQ